jgi:hypothetical protein
MTRPYQIIRPETKRTGRPYEIGVTPIQPIQQVQPRQIEQIQTNLYRNLSPELKAELPASTKQRMENLIAYPYGKISTKIDANLVWKQPSQEDIKALEKIPSPTWEDRLDVMREHTNTLMWKHPEQISWQEYAKKGISFGYGDVPEQPATTTQQKWAQTIGRVTSMVLLRNIASPVIKEAAMGVPGLAKPLATLEAASKVKPWAVDYPLSIIQSGAWGTFFGALAKADSVEERVKNAVRTGAWFAGFQTLAFPIHKFFFDSVAKLGEKKYTGLSKEARTMLDSKEGSTLISKGPDTVWFRHPTNPNQVFKVTEKGIFTVPQSHAPAQPIQIMTQKNVELFRYDEAIYKKLLSVIKKGTSTPITPQNVANPKLIISPVSKITPAPGVKPVNITPPVTPIKPVIPKEDIKVTMRKEPSTITGAGTRQIIIKDHPEIYTDSFILLEDRKSPEVKKWQERQTPHTGEPIDYSQLRELYPKEESKIVDFIKFERPERGPIIAHLSDGRAESIAINAEYYKWLTKEGYTIKSTGKEKTPLVLERGGKDVGLIMIMDVGKPIEELKVAEQPFEKSNQDIAHNIRYQDVQAKYEKQGPESLTPDEIEVLSQGPEEVITPDGIQQVNKENAIDSEITKLYAGVPLDEIAKIPVSIRGTKRALIDALGSHFVRYHGLTPEIRNILIKLHGGNDLRQEELVELFLKDFPITKDQAKLLTKHQENPEQYPIPEDMKALADKVEGYLELSKDLQKEKGLMNEFFPESFIKRAQKEIQQHKEVIPKLKQEKAINRHKDEIEKLEEYIDFLQQLRYVPHAYLQSEEMQRNILRLMPEGKITSKFRDTLSKLKGREFATLDDAKEAGLLPEEDIRILLASHFEYLYRKVAIHDTIESLKQNPTAVLKEDKAPDGWEKVAISQLDGYKVNPFLVDYFEDFAMKEQNFLAKGYDNINYLGKSLFFYNPIILPFWDAFQGFAAGSIQPWRPIYTSKLAIQSIKDVTQKSELYKEAVTGQLYGTPIAGRFAQPIENTMKVLIDRTDKEYPGWKKAVERITGKKVDWKSYTVIPDLYAANWKYVWGVDRIMRTMTLRHGMNMGMDIDTAIKYANNFHANYNLFTSKAKAEMNKLFLVPTYKSNMMVNLPTYLGKNVFEIAKSIPKGEKATPEQLASLKSIFRIGIFFAGALAFAAWRDYHLREGYRLVRKLKEPQITDEGKILTEEIITLPGPFAEIPKLLARLKLGPKGLFMYMAKVPQMIWGLSRNARWMGEKYYDEGASKEVQLRTSMVGLLKDYLAPYGQYDIMTKEEQDAFGNVMNLFGMATYKRGSTEQRIFWEIQTKQKQLTNYLKKPNISWEDKQKAIESFDNFAKQKIRELENFIELYE